MVHSSSNELNRTLGLKLAVVAVVGNILGSGVYKKVAPMAAELDSAALVLLCWILGGIVTLFGALSSAELAGMLADTGGEFTYYKKVYNRFFAFIFGWSVFTVIKTATIASLAYVFTESLNGIVPLPELLTGWSDINLFGIFHPFADFNIKLVAIILILLLTLFNTSGIKTGMGLSTALLVLVVLGISMIILFGLTSSQSHISPVLNDYGTTSFHISSIFTAMLAAFWAYEGWSAVGYIAGEIKEPNRNVPKSLAIGVFIVIALYLAVNVTYLSLLTVPQLKSIYESHNQIAAVEAVRVFWGPKGVMLISFLILITTLGCNHASIISNARVYYAMAKEGLFFKKVGTVNKAKVPATALWYQGIWSSVLVLSGTFDQLTDMLIFAAFIFYGATTLGVIIMRIRKPDLHRPYKVWGYPVVPALFLVFCVGFIFNTIISRPREAGIGMVLIAIGIPFYFYFTRRSIKNKISS
ncbi:MAG TPA: amino acid permease [Cyclobacteriaceae bacterium]|nr:amino acid permease [Cyclobacteriaceae bacterium]